MVGKFQGSDPLPSSSWITPRQIRPEQRAQIIEKLKRFAGQQYSIATYPDDGECVMLAGMISAALRQAGWNPLPDQQFTTISHFDLHVLVYCNIGNAVSKAAAIALAQALVEASVDATPMLSADQQFDAVHIQVGKKSFYP